MSKKRIHFLPFMMHLTRSKEQAAGQEIKMLSIYRRLAFSAAFLLAVFNLVLILDVFVLPGHESVDTIESVTITHDHKITTGKGRRLFVNGFTGEKGDTLTIRSTIIFDVVERIWNDHWHLKMTRQVNGWEISRFFCMPLFLLGLLSLLFRKKWMPDNYVLFFLLPLLATVQFLLFMF